MLSLIEQAKKFAELKHMGQTRKFDKNNAYINHPLAVAERLAYFCKDEAMIAAALLHDTIEDTNTSYGEILQLFGIKVANLVEELTSDKEEANKIGKAQYLTNKINGLSEDARLIKFLDRENNVSDFPKSPMEFSKRYAKETQYILDHLNFEPSCNEKIIINSIREKISPYL